jgi:hypothetical protein
MSGSNGSKRHDGASQRAALAARIARQLNRDQQVRPSPSVSLPRLRCLEEDPPDDEAPERAA